MEISLKIPEVITIPDWIFWGVFTAFVIVGAYGVIRIFFPKKPDPWLRGG